jgi:hypothetical protein
MNATIVAPRTTDWHRLKALVLDSVSSPITKRVYNLGLDEFFEWFGEASLDFHVGRFRSEEVPHPPRLRFVYALPEGQWEISKLRGGLYEKSDDRDPG